MAYVPVAASAPPHIVTAMRTRARVGSPATRPRIGLINRAMIPEPLQANAHVCPKSNRNATSVVPPMAETTLVGTTQARGQTCRQVRGTLGGTQPRKSKCESLSGRPSTMSGS